MVFGLFEVLLVVFALDLLFHSTRVTVGPEGLEIRNRLLLMHWKRLLPKGEIACIQPKSGMQSGTRVYYNLEVQTRAGRKVTAGHRIPDKKHAQWLAGRLRQTLGLPD
jgi:hypothetical protein